jgi:hypothetical protein
MDDSNAPKAVSAVDVVSRSKKGAPKKIKIGEVARHFDVSVDLLRLYEREGLLIPLKSVKGTRYFTELDYPWIATVLRLIREAHLNFAGIRHLLALLPCWDILRCGERRNAGCSVISEAAAPCWMAQNCCNPGDCYACDVYREACRCANLKAFVVNNPA